MYPAPIPAHHVPVTPVQVAARFFRLGRLRHGGLDGLRASGEALAVVLPTAFGAAACESC
jgi:hypothetical protein